jgi:hypothetical protein
MTKSMLSSIGKAKLDKVDVGLGIGGLVVFFNWLLGVTAGLEMTMEAGIGLATGLTWVVQKFLPETVTTEVVSDAQDQA